jgi:hypothetical protein
MHSDRQFKSSFHSDDDSDHQKPSIYFHQNCCRLFFVFILVVLSIGTTTSLIIVLYTDTMKEKALAEKKKGWIEKWNIIKPYVKKFPLGFILGFIRNLLVLAIDRQSEL